MDRSRRTRTLFDRHRHPDGHTWSGADIERATGGEVSRFYVNLLQRGLIREPSFTRIYLISRAIGADLDEWVREDPVR